MMLRRFSHFSCTFRRFCTTNQASFDSKFSDSAFLEVPSTSKQYDVMVLHPHVRWGSSSASALKDPQRQLDEAVALVNTLPGFRVINRNVIGVDYSTKRKAIWGGGKIRELLAEKDANPFSALMVNVEMLNPMQQKELHDIFHVPVFDRYNVVLSIFKHYARTEEAHLQIQLAEIPYIRQRLHFLHKSPAQASVLHIDEEQGTFTQNPLEELRMREQTLRKKLREVVEAKKAKVESDPRTGAVPVVAVVGYTNAGKTSFVKRMTGSESLRPQDRLFATLDSTRHVARLPSGRLVSFVDTVGFLSDLPTHLFAAFETTLAHIKHANVIVHLRDVSNPDWRAQTEDVLKTMESIGLGPSELEKIITVDNKIDKCEEFKAEGEESLPISCTTGSGFDDLISVLDMSILDSLNCRPRKLRLKTSSPVIPYLYSEGLVTKEPLVEGDRLVFEVFMTDGEMAKMQKATGQLKRR